jgi:hypothetical protein
MLSEQDFTIAEVPVVEETKNTRTDRMELHLRNDEIEGKGTCTYEGLWKMDVKYKLADLSEVQRETYYQSLFSRGNNKCKVEDVRASDLKARDQVLRFDYSFRVPDYARAIGGERFVNLHLSRPLQNAQIEATRKLPLEHDFRSVNEQTTVLHLPAGAKVGQLPEGKSYAHDRFGFQITYAREAGKVIVRNRFYLKTLLIQPADFAAWNEMVSLLNEAYSESISLQ